jgi:hypothetical protein
MHFVLEQIAASADSSSFSAANMQAEPPTQDSSEITRNPAWNFVRTLTQIPKVRSRTSKARENNNVNQL